MAEAITGPIPEPQTFVEWLRGLQAGYIKVPYDGMSNKAVSIEAIEKVYQAYQEQAPVYPSGNFNHQSSLTLQKGG